MPHKIGIGAVFGIVAEDGVAKVGAPVHVYDRTTGQLVRRVYTDGSGGYVVNGLNDETSDYYLVATDEDGAIRKNALIQDYVQPIPAYQGSEFLGNGEYLLKQYNPYILHLYTSVGTNVASHVPSVNTFSLTCATDSVSGLNSLVAQTDILAAPHLPVMYVQNDILKGYNDAWTVQHSSYRYTHPSLSLLWGIDSGASQKIILNSTASEGFYSLYGINYDATTFTVSLFYPAASAFTVIGTYVIPEGAGRTGNHLLGASINSGTDAKLYFDGQLVGTFDMTSAVVPSGAATEYEQLMYIHSTTVSKYSADFVCTAGTFKTWLSAVYLKVLAAADHLAIYNAFYVPSTPLVTGYIREVSLDYPAYFYPLNDATTAAIVDPLRPYNPSGRVPEPDCSLLVYGSNMLVQQSVPVIGQVGAQFNGGTVVRNNIYWTASGFAPIGPGRDLWAEEFWIKLASTPSELGHVIVWSSTDTKNHYVAITTARKISAYMNCSAPATITFDYVLTLDTWAHVFINFNKVTGFADLYIDGVLQQSIAIDLPPLTVATTLTAGRICLGGFLNSSTVSSETLNGATVYGIAVYNYCLTAPRVLAHYNGKDIV